MKVKAPDNMCVMCGTVIPEGRQACPHCEAAVSETTDKIMAKVNDELEQAFRQGYLTGFNEGMKAACELKQQNEQLRRRIVVLENQARNTVDDVDGEFE
jgi:flagellar biosynthesis/type III secretory pathway protein FliH